MENTYELTNDKLSFTHPDRFITFFFDEDRGLFIRGEESGKEVLGMRFSEFEIQLMGLFFLQQSMKVNSNKG